MFLRVSTGPSRGITIGSRSRVIEGELGRSEWDVLGLPKRIEIRRLRRKCVDELAVVFTVPVSELAASFGIARDDLRGVRANTRVCVRECRIDHVPMTLRNQLAVAKCAIDVHHFLPVCELGRTEAVALTTYTA